MALNVDMGGDTLYVTDVFVGNTSAGAIAGTGVSSFVASQGNSTSNSITVLNGTTATSGGTGSTAAILIGTGATSSLGIYFGAGAPSSLVANHGSIYLNTTGSTVSTRMYINTTGVSTWTAVTTLA